MSFSEHQRKSSKKPVAEAVKSSENRSSVQLKDNRPQTAIQKKQVEAIANKMPEAVIQKKKNTTGIPDTLKSGIEDLSGHSMDDVKVHYNSSQPAQLNAHAYAQGTDIHLAPGQEKHLPHEAWHVVQQKQGRVKPTKQLKGKVNVNDDRGLEKEADVMGAKSMQLKQHESVYKGSGKPARNNISGKQSEFKTNSISGSFVPVQRVALSKLIPLKSGGYKTVYYSTHDAGTEFDDIVNAREHDQDMERGRGKFYEPHDRVPTNATYYKTKSRNVIPLSKQNPHTLSHSSTSFRLSKRMDDTDIARIIKDQVLSKTDFRKSVNVERPSTMNDIQVERMLTDYDLQHNELSEIQKKKNKPQKKGNKKEEYEKTKRKKHELIMRLMQMNPYSAYGKGGKSAALHIKGKGEKRDDSFDTAFDDGGKFNSEEGYKDFQMRRRRLFSDDEISVNDIKPKRGRRETRSRTKSGDGHTRRKARDNKKEEKDSRSKTRDKKPMKKKQG